MTSRARDAARQMLDAFHLHPLDQTARRAIRVAAVRTDPGAYVYADALEACAAVPALAQVPAMLDTDGQVVNALKVLRRHAGCRWFHVWRLGHEHERIVAIQAYGEESARRYCARDLLGEGGDIAELYAVVTSEWPVERRAEREEARRQALEERDARPTAPPMEAPPVLDDTLASGPPHGGDYQGDLDTVLAAVARLVDDGTPVPDDGFDSVVDGARHGGED